LYAYIALCRSELARENFNDNVCFLNERGAYEFFASRLAPTKALIDWYEGLPPPTLIALAKVSFLGDINMQFRYLNFAFYTFKVRTTRRYPRRNGLRSQHYPCGDMDCT